MWRSGHDTRIEAQFVQDAGYVDFYRFKAHEHGLGDTRLDNPWAIKVAA